MRVTVSRDGVQVATTGEITPTYREIRANGEGCGVTCRDASETVILSDAATL